MTRLQSTTGDEWKDDIQQGCYRTSSGRRQGFNQKNHLEWHAQWNSHRLWGLCTFGIRFYLCNGCHWSDTAAFMGAGQAKISVATAIFALSTLFIELIGWMFSLVWETERGIYFDFKLSILPAYECCTCADEIYRYELLQSLQKSQDLRLGQGRSWDVPIDHDSKKSSEWSRAVNVRGTRPNLATKRLRGHDPPFISKGTPRLQISHTKLRSLADLHPRTMGLLPREWHGIYKRP